MQNGRENHMRSWPALTTTCVESSGQVARGGAGGALHGTFAKATLYHSYVELTLSFWGVKETGGG